MHWSGASVAFGVSCCQCECRLIVCFCASCERVAVAWLYFVHTRLFAVVFGPGENVHSAEGGTASEELRVGPSGEVPGNECAARPGWVFFVCLCMHHCDVDSFSLPPGRLLRYSSRHGGGSGGHLRRNRKSRLSAHGLEARMLPARFLLFSPHVSCSPHHFRRVSVCNVHCTTFGSCPFTLYFPLVRPRTVTSRRRGLCERFLTFKGKQSEAGKHFSFAVFFLSRLSSAQS